MYNEFYITRQTFRECVHYSEPLSFTQWNDLPQEYKAAVLYLQFFDQITLAWEKVKSVYSAEADGVSTVLQYLDKNVKKIEAEPSRFTPNYIYRVAYNCLYCVCRDPNRFKREYENECSNICKVGEDELDLFDLYTSTPDTHQVMESLNRDAVSEDIWSLIENLDVDTQVVVAKILNDPTCLSLDRSRVDTTSSYQAKLHESWDISKSETGKAKKQKRAEYLKSVKCKGGKVFTKAQLDKVTDTQISATVEYLKDILAPYKAYFDI